MEIVKRLLAGDRKAAARLMSLIENDASQAPRLLGALYPHTGRAHIVGVTGFPGTGKSTLVGELTKKIRAQGEKVGIVAVDPTSPFSGGALLGDRIRMQELSTDEGVFIRSMATRGSLGGLARATGDVVKVLDALGQDLIFIETVGAGQSEVEIARAAHTVVVVVAPGLGDEIQAIKAGLFEIADLFVVNKADREGAEGAVATLNYLLDMNQADGDRWRPPILKTIAIRGEGVEAVVDALKEHLGYLKESGQLELKNRERSEGEVKRIIEEALWGRLLSRLKEGEWERMMLRIADRELDPYTAAEKLLESSGDTGK
ncbi:MAG TPA: methylmalonyl Co-A mutase-associated GTPase MeaB [Chloroflexi bacterium]|nr:methylmalonyl Co-A mutase-associated GTPase MeaB [Chloroflexota bacterium]